MSKVYLAGPDVFYPDAKERGEVMRQICSDHGFTALYPLDSAIATSTESRSRAIFEANVRLLNETDAVVANLRDFRGHEPDSGTVWEVSYALAKGKPVVAYLPTPGSLMDRMGGHDVGGRDTEGNEIENFDLPLNLMLAHSVSAVVYGSEEGFAGLRLALVTLRGLL